MEIIDIIKHSFIFPSNNLDKLAIFMVLNIVLAVLFVGGIISLGLVAYDSVYVILFAILFILSLIVGFIVTGYQISILKSGIDFDDNAPSFDWKNDFIKGIKMLVVSIVYFIIPAIIVGIIALITNVPGNVMQAIQEYGAISTNATAVANSTAPALSSVSEATMAALFSSIGITVLIAVILFIIFAFIQTMGEARLANTGSLGEAINIPEALKDISRIGVSKVIAVILLMIIVMVVIQGILGFLYGQIPQLSILSIIVTPYLSFFSQRAIGVLYSDIA